MADTGKTVRVARTNFGGGLAQAGTPTERSQIVAQEVHQYRDTQSDSLYALNDAISRFMGAGVNALTSVQEGYQRGKLAQIEQDNKAQKQQALGDALAGREMDAEFANDSDYYDAFRSVKAQRDGFEAAQDFTTWYMQEWLPENPTGDLSSARQQWALENLTGSDDSDYEGQLLASFFDRTDGLLPEHMKSVLKYQTDKGVEALGQLIEADVASGAVTPERLNDYFNKARTLDPLNANEAPTRVVNALLASASNHPDKMMGVSKMLSMPGTGVNGKSFAESFPDAYAGFQQSAVEAYNAINSTKELDAFTSLQDRVREAKTADDLQAITVDAMKFRQEFGAPGKVDQLLGEIGTALTAIGQDLDLSNAAMQWIGGDRSVDPSDVRKGFPLMLEQMGLKTILDAEPKQAAQIIAGLGSVTVPEVTDVLSTAILDTRDPATQAKAMETLSILAKTAGQGSATANLSTSAKNLYEHAAAYLAVSPMPMDQILQRVNEARDGVKDYDVEWTKITGAASGKEADEAVAKVINAEMTTALGSHGFMGIGAFGGIPVDVPLGINQTIMDLARVKAIEMNASGIGWETAVKQAVREVAADADIIPGANGRRSLSLSATKNSTYVTDDGHVGERPRMGTAVINPTTGRPVDTVKVYEEQTKQLERDIPALLPGGSAAGVHLVQGFDPAMSARGLLTYVDETGTPLVFAAGTEIILGPQSAVVPQIVDGVQVGTTLNLDYSVADQTRVTLPETAAEMEGLFDLPEGVKFVRVDTPLGVTWQLGYRPNFGSQQGKTLSEQAASFTGPDPTVGVTLGDWKLPQIDIGLIKDRN